MELHKKQKSGKHDFRVADIKSVLIVDINYNLIYTNLNQLTYFFLRNGERNDYHDGWKSNGIVLSERLHYIPLRRTPANLKYWFHKNKFIIKRFEYYVFR